MVLVITQSGAVSPSPRPFKGSLLDTEVTEHVAVGSHKSDTLTDTVTGAIL
jgi:hypothetical protein